MKVPVQISFRNFKSSDAILSHLHERIAWLEHFSNQIISCHIVVEKPNKNHQQGNLFHVRIDLRLPGAELVISREPPAHKAHTDVYVTIHDAFDEARRELEDYVRKHRKDVKNRNSAPHAYVIRLIQEDERYGFIRTEDDRDLYFHSNSVLNDHYDQLKLGTEVKYREEMGEKGPQASTIEIVGQEGRHFRAA